MHADPYIAFPLMQASISDSIDDAKRHWDRWRQMRGEISDASTDEIRIVPYTWHKLKDVLPKDRAYCIAEGLYKRAAYKNSLQLYRLGSIKEFLDRLGVEFCLMKGIPLILDIYPTAGCRPTSDVDILIDGAQREFLVSRFFESGWKAEHPKIEITKNNIFDYCSHGASFVLNRQSAVDLHWRALQWDYPKSIDLELLSRAEVTEYKGLSIRRLSDTDLFFHSLANHILFGRGALSPWLLDLVLLERKQHIDFDLVASLIGRCGVTHAIKSQLARVEEFAPDALASLGRSISKAPVPKFEIECHKLMMGGILEQRYLKFAIANRSLDRVHGTRNRITFALYLIRFVFFMFRKDVRYWRRFPMDAAEHSSDILKSIAKRVFHKISFGNTTAKERV